MSLQSQTNISEVMLIDYVVMSLPLMFSPEAETEMQYPILSRAFKLG